MMKPIILQAALFRGHATDPVEHERSRKSMLFFLEALVAHDRLWLQTHPNTPKIYESGVRYVYKDSIEAPAWQDIVTCLSKGYGDCKDFAAWRVAELKEQGIDCTPLICWRKVDGSYRFHALVEFPDGTEEDPSAMMGMGDHKPFKYQVVPPVVIKGVKGMDAARMAKAIVTGLVSKDKHTRNRAKLSYAKVASMAGDDPECNKAVAMVRRGCAMMRKKIVAAPTTLGSWLGGLISPKKSIAAKPHSYKSVSQAPHKATASSASKAGYHGPAMVKALKPKLLAAKGYLKAVHKRASHKSAPSLHGLDASSSLSDIDAEMRHLTGQLADLNGQSANLELSIVKLQNMLDSGNPAAAAHIPLLQHADQNIQQYASNVSADIDNLNAILDNMNAQLDEAAAAQAEYQAKAQRAADAAAAAAAAAAQAVPPSYAPNAISSVPLSTRQGPALTPYSTPYTTPDLNQPSYTPQNYGGGGGYGDDSSSFDDSVPFDDSYQTSADDDLLTDDGLNGLDEIVSGDDFARDFGHSMADPGTGAVLSSLFGVIPIVGPLLAPLGTTAIQAAGNEIQKANGGDPTALASIQATKSKAQQGDPEAAKKLDALQRVHKANKAVTEALKDTPFKWSFSNVYRAAVEGPHSLAVH